MNKTRQVNIRLTDQQHRNLTIRAIAAGISLSEYIRNAAIYWETAKNNANHLEELLKQYKAIALSRTKWLEDEE